MSATMIGLDTAKSVFQIHAIDTGGNVVCRRKLQRGELVGFFDGQPRCTVVMEACGAAHHWARVIGRLGHEVKLIAPEAVRPFVKRSKKNDAADAAAICTAATRPDARFVAVKSVEQQSVLAAHSARTLLVKQQTMLASAMRDLAAEFGMVQPCSPVLSPARPIWAWRKRSGSVARRWRPGAGDSPSTAWKGSWTRRALGRRGPERIPKRGQPGGGRPVDTVRPVPHACVPMGWTRAGDDGPCGGAAQDRAAQDRAAGREADRLAARRARRGSTLADLHAAVQAAMGWDDIHLHRFRILGRRYDPEYADLARVRLADLRLRAGERFSYVYNHSAPWEHELRLEALGPGMAGRRYPRCSAGRHACPPGWCPGSGALDESKAGLLGLTSVEDLRFMAGFGRATLDARDGKASDALDVLGPDDLERSLGRQKRREALLARFERQRANAALGLLATAGAGATPRRCGSPSRWPPKPAPMAAGRPPGPS